MKTSIFIIAALFFNTTLLVAEPLAVIVKGVHSFIFLGIEAVLIFGYVVNVWLNNLHKACEIELGHLDIIVLKSK